MTFAEIKAVVTMIEDPHTDLKSIISKLIDTELVTLENLYKVMSDKCEQIINGVAISIANYEKYVALNRGSGAIPAIKEIRNDYSLGLKDAKDINDIIKEKLGIKNYV